MSVKITAANLRAIAPGASPAIVEGIVKNRALLTRYGIDTPNRVSHFFGQSAVETQGFTRLEENLYYTTAARLMAVWPSRFRSAAQSAPYLRNPEKLANSVYASRLGNGPPASGDGWRYRGSGCKQTTGKFNFGQVEKETGLPVVAHPEMLRRFPEALESACIYWRDNRLNRFADAGDVAGLTRAVQGGTGGLADRRIYTDRAMKIKWGSTAEPKPAPAADPILRNGARSKPVREAQERLEAHGFSPGAIDGIFGPGTENAVSAFQEAKGLMADGVIGPVTWAALRAEPEAAEAPGHIPDADDIFAAPGPERLPEAVSEPSGGGFWAWLARLFGGR